jgi:NADH:ubiquinone reductase (H+-translocating)
MAFAIRSNQPHVVIVGAGFGGLAAARALKHADALVTVVDRRNHHLFQPLLYQVATAGLSPGEIAYPIRGILRDQKNTKVLLEEAVAIDVSSRRVVLKSGELHYDYLIVATGATHSYFGHDDWEPWAPGLKSLEDALEIRRRILLAFERAEREIDAARRKALLTFVIVGAGPTGVELAGAIAEIARHVMVQDFRSVDPREARITLVEAGPRILPAFPESLSAKAEAALRKMGVEVMKGSAVTAVLPQAVVIRDQEIATSTTLWAAGVKASPLARSLGAPLDRAGRVLVQPDLSIPDHPEVFVIGDLAAFIDHTGKPLPGLSPVAMQMGRRAARNIQASAEGKARRPFHYFDKGIMATIGRAAAVADIRGLKLSGLIAWLAWLFVHILFLIGFRNRFVVMIDWAWSYVAYKRGARLITGNIDEYPAKQSPIR